MTIARGCMLVGCSLVLGCMGPESHSRAVATADFPRTWDQIDQGATEPEAAGASQAPVPVATGPSKPVDVLDLTDGTELVGIITQQAPGQYVVLVTAAGEQHTVPWSRIKSAGGQPPTPTPPAQPAEPPKRGVVVLKDGTKIPGILKRVEPGQFVIVDTPDGGERTLAWDRVSEVNVTAGAADAGVGR